MYMCNLLCVYICISSSLLISHTCIHAYTGQSCWNGPARSAVVQLKCGAVEEVVEVSEPSVCFYDFVMLTPLVCDDSVVQASVMKLKQLGVDVTGEEGERIAREEL